MTTQNSTAIAMASLSHHFPAIGKDSTTLWPMLSEGPVAWFKVRDDRFDRNGFHLNHREGAEAFNSSKLRQSDQTQPLQTLSKVDCTTSDLPTAPLPTLEETLGSYYESVSAFCSAQELSRTFRGIEMFLSHDGLGRELQKRLKDRATNPKINGWLSDLYNNHVYLDCRAPVNPLQHFYGSHVDCPFRHSQAERAAIIVAAAAQFRLELMAGRIEPDFSKGDKLCMDSLQWLFNSSRKPRIDRDVIQRSPENDYCIVLRRGHYFKLVLPSGHEIADITTLRSLKQTFDELLSLPDVPAPSVAALTSDERDSWSKIRQMVQMMSLNNRHLLNLIEGAAFMICLDEEAPNTPTERSNHFLLADPSSRWSDKTLQFVVCSNGASAYLCENSHIDGETLIKLNEAIKSAIVDYKPEALGPSSPNNVYLPQNLERHVFHVDACLNSQIELVSQSHLISRVETEYINHTYETFGADLLRAHDCAPEIGFQLVIQLASLMYFGYQPPSWETVSMRRFHKGRVDIMQTVLPSVARFCAAMHDPKSSESQNSLRQRFYDAAEALTLTRQKVSSGHGFASHLYALQEVMREGEAMPSLFEDPIYSKTRPSKIMTDCVGWSDAIQDGGFVMPDPEFVWVHYEVHENSCRYSIKGPTGMTKLFLDALETAGQKMWTLLQSS